MPETRNLTQLASPFGEGKGEAYILPSGKTDPYFFQALEQIKKDKAAEKDRQQKALELRAKAIEDWSPNYWMGHQGYFQDKVSGVKSDLEDLMVNGGIKNGVWDMNNPKVKESVMAMNKATQDAKLSTQWGTQMQKWWTSPESQKKLYTPESRQAYEDYALNSTNFNGDFAGLVNKQPQLVPSTPLAKDIATGTVITHFNQALPKDIVDAKDAEEANKKSDDYAQSIYDRVMGLPLSTSEFANAWSADDPTAPERQREAMAETMKEQVKKVILDKFKLTKLNQGQEKIDETKNYHATMKALGWDEHAIQRARLSIQQQNADTYKNMHNLTGDATDPIGLTTWALSMGVGKPEAFTRLNTLPVQSVENDPNSGKPLMAMPTRNVVVKAGDPNIKDQYGNPQDASKKYVTVEYDHKVTDSKDNPNIITMPISPDLQDVNTLVNSSWGAAYANAVGKTKTQTPFTNPDFTVATHKKSETIKTSGATKLSGKINTASLQKGSLYDVGGKHYKWDGAHLVEQ